MPNYNTVDVDRLNSAITRSADKIREKLGSADPIAWNPDSGLEAEIGKIPRDISSDIIEKTITEIDDDRSEAIGTQVFGYNDNLTRVRFRRAKSTGSSAFRVCSSLALAEFDCLESIATATFYGCSALDTLIIRTDGVCTLSSTAAFTGTQFALTGSGGTAYVPEVWLEEYRNATNWSSLQVTFVAIEGSEYE